MFVDDNIEKVSVDYWLPFEIGNSALLFDVLVLSSSHFAHGTFCHSL